MHIQYCLSLQAARLNFVPTKNKRNNSTFNFVFSGMFKYPEKRKIRFLKRVWGSFLWKILLKAASVSKTLSPSVTSGLILYRDEIF